MLSVTEIICTGILGYRLVTRRKELNDHPIDSACKQFTVFHYLIGFIFVEINMYLFAGNNLMVIVIATVFGKMSDK